MHKFNKIQLVTDWFSEEAQNITFDFETRSICSLYARLMRKHGLNFATGKGVVADFGPGKEDGKCKQATPFFLFSSTRDIRGFERLSDLDKKKLTLDLIDYVMEGVSHSIGVTESGFTCVSAEIESMSFQNSWRWRKGTTKSPDQSMKCDIFVDHEVSQFDLRAVVSDKSGTVLREGVIHRCSKPDELVIDGHLGELIWFSEDEARLNPKSYFRDPICFRIHDLTEVDGI